MLLRLRPFPWTVGVARLPRPSPEGASVLHLYLKCTILKQLHLLMIMTSEVDPVLGPKSLVKLPCHGWLIYDHGLGSKPAQLDESGVIVGNGLVLPLLQVLKPISKVLSSRSRKESDIKGPNKLVPRVSLSSAGPGHALPPFVSLCIKVESGYSNSVSTISNAHGAKDLHESPHPFL